MYQHLTFTTGGKVLICIFYLSVFFGLTGCDFMKKVHGTINGQNKYEVESKNCRIHLFAVPAHGNVNGLYIYINCCPGTTVSIENLNFTVFPDKSAKISSMALYDEGNKKAIDKKSFTTSSEATISLGMYVVPYISLKDNKCYFIIPPGQLIYYEGEPILKDTLKISL